MSESNTPLTRRGFLGAGAAVGLAAGGALAFGSSAYASTPSRTHLLPLKVVAKVPFQVNQVALTSNNTMFVSGPRHISPEQSTPSLAKRRADGTFEPFPGNSWNDWAPGDSGVDQFVNLITLNVFWDDTVWACDWGAPMSDATAVPAPGAQKIVQLDAASGRILRVIRFDESILPVGGKLNGIQRYGDYLYVADSGLGALIFQDLRTGRTIRRLSGAAAVTSTAEEIARNPSTVSNAPTHSDTLHITEDGEWLYWSSPQGPFRRVRAELVRDPRVTDDHLAAQVQFVADVDVTPGACMDSLGNLYLSDINIEGFTLLPVAPHDGAVRSRLLTLSTSSPGLASPDESFISSDRHLYTASSQFAAGDAAAAPWLVYSVALPDVFDGVRLGSQVSGRARH